jgi:tetratricopeptide (TPR) repeat protein
MLAPTQAAARRFGMRCFVLALAICALPVAAPARAQAQAPADRGAIANKLLDALKRAPSPEVAAVLEAQIQQIWLNQGTPAVTLLMTRGLRELKADADNDAIEDFGDAITLDPTLAEAYLQRAVARWQSGDTNGAIADIEATLKQDPRHFTAFETLSRIAEARKDWKGAYDAWQQLLVLDPQTPDGADRLKELKRKAFGEET